MRYIYIFLQNNYPSTGIRIRKVNAYMRVTAIFIAFLSRHLWYINLREYYFFHETGAFPGGQNVLNYFIDIRMIMYFYLKWKCRTTKYFVSCVNIIKHYYFTTKFNSIVYIPNLYGKVFPSSDQFKVDNFWNGALFLNNSISAMSDQLSGWTLPNEICSRLWNGPRPHANLV